jgi:GT2 family glycosyltransferase
MIGISAIVTAYDRIDQTIDTLKRIKACEPSPDEILVHVDGNRTDCADAIRRAHPDVALILSEGSVGPGGGRNKLVTAARNDLVASFDDDSYPLDDDYFERVKMLAAIEDSAAVLAARIYHRGEKVVCDRRVVSRTASFGAGGAVFRRRAFLDAGGLVPLVVAYGMEEEDLALRLYDRGLEIVRSPWLRVFHDTDLGRHEDVRITAGVIANLALLAYLRYPPRFWPYGILQVVNRVAWCMCAGRWDGILTGLASIPRHLARHQHFRALVSVNAMRSRMAARRALERSFDSESSKTSSQRLDASNS